MIIFGYELIDLILFDSEAVKASLVDFTKNQQFVIYLSLLTNLITLSLIRRQFGVFLAFLLLAFGWSFSGYYFYLELFAPIYWVSKYATYFCFAMTVIILSRLFWSRKFMSISPERSILFSLVTLTPYIASYVYYSDIVFTVGTHATVAALASIVLFSKRSDALSFLISLASVLWCTIILTVFLVIE